MLDSSIAGGCLCNVDHCRKDDGQHWKAVPSSDCRFSNWCFWRVAIHRALYHTGFLHCTLHKSDFAKKCSFFHRNKIANSYINVGYTQTAIFFCVYIRILKMQIKYQNTTAPKFTVDKTRVRMKVQPAVAVAKPLLFQPNVSQTPSPEVQTFLLAR